MVAKPCCATSLHTHYTHGFLSIFYPTQYGPCDSEEQILSTAPYMNSGQYQPGKVIWTPSPVTLVQELWYTLRRPCDSLATIICSELYSWPMLVQPSLTKEYIAWFQRTFLSLLLYVNNEAFWLQSDCGSKRSLSEHESNICWGSTEQRNPRKNQS